MGGLSSFVAKKLDIFSRIQLPSVDDEAHSGWPFTLDVKLRARVEGLAHAIQSRRENPCPEGNDDGIVVGMAFVYMLRYADGTLYVGHTGD